MKIMQVTVQVGRAEAASAEVLVLTHCEGERIGQAGCRARSIEPSGRVEQAGAIQGIRRQGQRSIAVSHAGHGACETAGAGRLGQEERGHA